MALVHDEYGHFEGPVTPTDLTGAIVGGFRSDEDPGDERAALQREDGSWHCQLVCSIAALGRIA
jgi:putative hemolysin